MINLPKSQSQYNKYQTTSYPTGKHQPPAGNNFIQKKTRENTELSRLKKNHRKKCYWHIAWSLAYFVF
jgi:hypothetical protein